jgi:hypothetical protein
VRDGIAKNAEANGRIDIARDLGPLLKISQRIAFGSCLLFHRFSIKLGSTGCQPVLFGSLPKSSSLRLPLGHKDVVGKLPTTAG